MDRPTTNEPKMSLRATARCRLGPRATSAPGRAAETDRSPTHPGQEPLRTLVCICVYRMGSEVSWRNIRILAEKGSGHGDHGHSLSPNANLEQPHPTLHISHVIASNKVNACCMPTKAGQMQRRRSDRVWWRGPGRPWPLLCDGRETCDLRICVCAPHRLDARTQSHPTPPLTV